LEKFLKNKKTYGMLLDFARRSYCMESVLCYKDIEKFKRSKPKMRNRMGLHIIKTYLKVHSPVQINLSAALLSHVHEWEIVLSGSTPADYKLFEEAQLHCLLDITDVFERLKASDKKVKELVATWARNKDGNK